MLLTFVLAALVALLASSVLPTSIGAQPVLWAHLLFTLALLPLMTAAMQHFSPVLARGRRASVRLARLPWLFALVGAGVLAVFVGWLPWLALNLFALLTGMGVLAMLRWLRQLARRALGAPHPGLAWYVAALGCLALGLLAAALIPLLPQWHLPLAALHRNINLYGMVALTAVGTLQVLMPTATGHMDAGATQRLHLDLKWALAGALCLATGKAVFEPLAWLGVALWLWPLLRLAAAWLLRDARAIFAWHGVAPALAAALFGLMAAMVGTLYPGDYPETLTVFVPAFLFPLVSGAAAQLLPVWLAPRASLAVHQAGQKALSRFNCVRALLFVATAILPLAGYRCAGIPAVTALLWFVLGLVFWLLRDRSE